MQTVCSAPLKDLDLPAGNGFACAGAPWPTDGPPPLRPSKWLPAVGDEGHAPVGGWKASSLKAASSLNIQLWSCHSGRSAFPAPLAAFGFAAERSIQLQGRHGKKPTETNPCSQTPCLRSSPTPTGKTPVTDPPPSPTHQPLPQDAAPDIAP